MLVKDLIEKLGKTRIDDGKGFTLMTNGVDRIKGTWKVRK